MRSAFLLLFAAANILATGVPDFSGTWKIDALQSPQRGSGYNAFSIAQNNGEISVVYSDGPLTYRLDAETTYPETNLGNIPGFARMVTTGAVQVNRAGMFTRVTAFGLTPAGREMTVESTGCRDTPPAMLRGYPYDQKTDPIYRKFRGIFRKVD